jgi:hypothetical protein
VKLPVPATNLSTARNRFDHGISTGRATAGAVKAVNAPRFLHLATHGVYEPPPFTSHQIVGGIPAAAATYQTSSIVPVAARGSIVAISGTSLAN